MKVSIVGKSSQGVHTADICEDICRHQLTFGHVKNLSSKNLKRYQLSTRWMVRKWKAQNDNCVLYY